jgi:hypothetical protein
VSLSRVRSSTRRCTSNSSRVTSCSFSKVLLSRASKFRSRSACRARTHWPPACGPGLQQTSHPWFSAPAVQARPVTTQSALAGALYWCKSPGWNDETGAPAGRGRLTSTWHASCLVRMGSAR